MISSSAGKAGFSLTAGARRMSSGHSRAVRFRSGSRCLVDTLTVGERQQFEILRLLWLGARLLILDEPTTGISQPQKEKLFATLRSLAGQGMAEGVRGAEAFAEQTPGARAARGDQPRPSPGTCGSDAVDVRGRL